MSTLEPAKPAKPAKPLEPESICYCSSVSPTGAHAFGSLGCQWAPEAPRPLHGLYAIFNNTSTGLPEVVRCEARRHAPLTKGADAMYQLVDCPEEHRVAWMYQEYLSPDEVHHSELSCLEHAEYDAGRAVNGAELVLGNARSAAARLATLHTQIENRNYARNQQVAELAQEIHFESLEPEETMRLEDEAMDLGTNTTLTSVEDTNA